MNPDGDYNTFPFREFTTDWKVSTQPLFRYYQEINKPIFALYGELDGYTGCDPHQAIEILSKVHPQPELITTQVIPDCDHGFKDKEELEVAAVVAWLQKTFL
jgi:pimeloyl-ACP methyl ester carboxylesterase